MWHRSEVSGKIKGEFHSRRIEVDDLTGAEICCLQRIDCTNGVQNKQQSSYAGTLLPTPRRMRNAYKNSSTSVSLQPPANKLPVDERWSWNSSFAPSSNPHAIQDPMNPCTNCAVPVVRRCAAVKLLPTADTEDCCIGNETVKLSSTWNSPADLEIGRAEGLRKRYRKGYIHGYNARIGRRSQSVTPTRLKPSKGVNRERSQSTNLVSGQTAATKFLPVLPKRSAQIKELTIQRPNAYKSQLRLSLLKGLQQCMV